ncbi:MAG: hypothetical protein CW691_03275 [Candidatus Bathyarchaeum sp.]|nr:MAG: hypothetical protein CW691_03275 [Candidatus Bathyarchaeum sp.]
MNSATRILVIDDDEIICETLSAALKDEGFVVDTAENGKEAIAKSHANFYNLAIVDWRLPDIEGTKLLGELKETTPKMAKILLTGYPSMSNAIEAVNNRADSFLVKPVRFEKLLEKIKELLKQQEEEKKFSEEKMTKFIETKAKTLTNNRS